MPRPTRQRTIELLDAVYDLLKNRTAVVHYKPLAKAIIASGLWAEPWSDDPEKALYNAIFAHFKAHGKNGLFLLFKGGYVCTTNVPGAELYDETVAMGVQRQIKQQPKPVTKPTEKRCGNCAFIQWRGPNAVTHETGTCSKYRFTGRPRVYLRSEPCTEWRQKSMQKQQTEQHESKMSVIDGLIKLHEGRKKR